MFSLTNLLSGLFLLFICHSIWNLVTLFRPPECKIGELCYSSYLNSKPSLNLLLFASDNTISSLTLVDNITNFDYDTPFERELQLALPTSTRQNGSLFMHVVLFPARITKKGLSLSEVTRFPDAVYYRKKVSEHVVPKDNAFNLLKDEGGKKSYKPVTHIQNKFAITICTDNFSVPNNHVPFEIAKHVNVNHRSQLLPILVEDFLQTKRTDLVEVKPDTESFKMTFAYSPSSFGKLRFLLQIEATLHQFLKLGFTQKDLDEVKGVFADTNLYLLCATMFVGSIHLLFDFLSFKNDVRFWKSKTSMAGLSTKAVLWRAFSQTIIFLFLLDQGTSLLVLIPSGIATVIEFWKLKKVFKATVIWENGLPKVHTNRMKLETAAEAKTREYDDQCMSMLSYVLYPLCLGAAIYSLIYQAHKSWYSWVINCLVNAVYAFGFLFMLPQLFINYRLKSVAALPWRAFMYRAFNTFIDDIFAFIITMPTAHRIACFRDDIVFIIYLYQRWLYPIDKTRTDDITSEDLPTETQKKLD
ncbi:cleft lip and palate transmembrane protein 1-like protein [Agrilus planipennis]|uniref:Lipid scramblase CLPTM1L n=1 Tax=Agrilus planipennis TaxID=224129 RepID=A0A1W4XTG7_AGRPL|nr:cleft lip and palate transmembrane protein 1-like protein [Agrilus planipennis]XP_025836733.1 cleft lip and palate transmembrane protein 1-like protein [Agrilus planipennis]